MNACALKFRPLRHVATVTHSAPGEAVVTCTCEQLRSAVDVDAPDSLTFVLTDHLTRAANGTGRLLVDDTRTRRRYTVTDDNAPEISLLLTGATLAGAR